MLPAALAHVAPAPAPPERPPANPDQPPLVLSLLAPDDHELDGDAGARDNRDVLACCTDQSSICLPRPNASIQGNHSSFNAGRSVASSRAKNPRAAANRRRNAIPSEPWRVRIAPIVEKNAARAIAVTAMMYEREAS